MPSPRGVKSHPCLVINAGSSSVKFSVFDLASGCTLLFKDEIERVDSIEKSLQRIPDMLAKAGHDNVKTIGHRVVHGGKEFSAPVIVTDSVMKKLEALIPLAPLHQPYNLEAIQVFAKLHPDIPQIACFDTAFHYTQPRQSELFALPRSYAEEGILRYGFHGLSYEYIASVLPEHLGEKAEGRVIVAHLGNGASMCAMKQRKSVATTMGFTALDGLMMGTRCGNLDPGVVLYLLEEKGMTIEEVTTLLYKESGLKGVSGISGDMRDLLASNAPEAKEAIDLFCYQAAKQLAGLIPALGGLDTIVFTAGIGENSPAIRKNICDRLSWLGVKLDDKANKNSQTSIHSKDKAITIHVIPTDEERMIAQHVLNLFDCQGIYSYSN